MDSTELHTLIIEELRKAHGGGTVRWRNALGEIKLYPLSTHAHCNWDVRPAGRPAEVAAVEAVVDRIRLSHPVVEES